jgi:bifunctional UDP-N-acetylglucosamine pyrophosphorylase/glucosamine-1-phosphate N-acetyltransferase
MSDPAGKRTAPQRAAVILAAGQGTRMRSPTPKVLHRVGGRVLLDRAIDAAENIDCGRIVVVAGAHSPEVAEHAAARLGAASVAIQDPPLGTGHAVRAAEAALQGFGGDVVVTYADTPLLDAEAVAPLFAAQEAGADLVVLGFQAADPGPYGRLIVDDDGDLCKIVEAKDAAPEELKVAACNSGVLAASAPVLFSLLAEVTNQNAKGEYYLTDVVALARARGLKVKVVFTDEAKVMGVNSQAELAVAEGQFQIARRAALLDAGVTMTAPETVFFSWDTQIAPGVIIEPNVVFGPGVTVEAGAVIRAFCHLEGAVVRVGALIGPYARLRGGADIGKAAHIGNFVEVKKVKVGAGAKANHLSYLGDGTVGEGANIGAGTIFCNYDGFDKHQTHVGARAFVGSNSSLVAPVSIGAGAYTGSGSVITLDVAPDSLALERGLQTEKQGWAAKFRARKMGRDTK